MNIGMNRIWSDTTDTFARMDGSRIVLVIFVCYFWGALTSVSLAILGAKILGVTMESSWFMISMTVFLGVIFCCLSFVFIPWPRNMIRCMGESGFKLKNWVFIRNKEVILEPYMADLHNYEDRLGFYEAANEWLLQNNKARYVAYQSGHDFYAYFNRKKDAVHFKMVWG